MLAVIGMRNDRPPRICTSVLEVNCWHSEERRVIRKVVLLPRGTVPFSGQQEMWLFLSTCAQGGTSINCCSACRL